VKLGHTDGVFRELSDAIVGPPIDLSDLAPERHPPALLETARRVWLSRVQTEFRSIQIMTRFVTEVVGAGDPIEVWAGAVELVRDEVRHTGLCAALCEALGAEPRLPDPVELKDPERYLAAPMAQRALTTAIAMLAINETISVAFIEDLRARCDNPAVKRVLDATVEDEEGHEDFGWEYVARGLARFPIATLGDWKHLVKTTLAPHQKTAEAALGGVPADRRRLDAHEEPELAALGLFSPARQALVYERCMTETLAPRLEKLGLL
jgi:hypothetical protein